MAECSSCKKNRIIINKKYNLCPDCNNLRLNPNYREDQIAKQIQYNNTQRIKQQEKKKQVDNTDRKPIIQTKPRTSVRKVSTKEKDNKQKLHQVYAQIDQERERFCSGCGRSDVPLSHSHIISRHQNKALESDPENIVYDCLSMGNRKGCHDRWEHASQKEKKVMLLNYEERMAYIRSKDRLLYHRLKSKEPK